MIQVSPELKVPIDLREASGHEAAWGTFRTYLPKFKRLGLVYADRDQVRASETLFS